MNEELKQYQVNPEPFWQSLPIRGVDGYSAIALAEKREWHALAAWGKDGWVLGSWPYVIIFFRNREGYFDVVEYVEGDVTMWACPTEEIREAITNELAFFHWKHQEEEWVRDFTSADELPDEYKGPYRP